MGTIYYAITYANKEEWSETRPFYDMQDYWRLTSMEYCAALAEAYKAETVTVAGVTINGEEHHGLYVGRDAG